MTIFRHEALPTVSSRNTYIDVEMHAVLLFATAGTCGLIKPSQIVTCVKVERIGLRASCGGHFFGVGVAVVGPSCMNKTHLN